MKKILLILSILCVAASASADGFTPKKLGKTIRQQSSRVARTADFGRTPFNTNKNPERAQMKAYADNGFTIQFCDEVYTWTYAIKQNKCTYRCYLYITPEMATQIAGNKITEITFSTASDFPTAPRSGSVFVTESLDGEPTTSTACTITDCYAQGSVGGAWEQTVALEQPYEIKANTGFYFGYIVENCRYSIANQATQSTRADYPIGIDYMQPCGFSGYVDVFDNKGEYLVTVDMEEDYETNLYLAATTVGEAEGFVNFFTLGSMSVGSFSCPILQAGASAEALMPIYNRGSNAITSVEYSLDLNGTPGAVTTSEIAVAPGKAANISFQTPELVPGHNYVTLNIKKVNGVDCSNSSTAACIALQGEGYARQFVVEEGTGTWCGYCPRGIVGLDKMSQKYPDSFIGIAVHSGDNMQAISYQPLVNDFFTGFPSCIVNRDPLYVFDPSFDLLEACYGPNYWGTQTAPARLDIKSALPTGGKPASAKVDVSTTFAYDEADANYRLAFVLLEDGIVDTQENYYSGNPDELEWWGSQDSRVTWTYEHTARDIFDYQGLAGSIPTAISAGKPVQYSADLSLSHISNIDKASVVVLLLDGPTGTILNAAKCKLGEAGTSAVETISIAGNSAAAIYNLKGQRLQAPQKGINIIGGKKVLVK